MGDKPGNRQSLLRPDQRRPFSSFEDWTIPADRTFGYYLITVNGWEHAQVIRASHPTAARIARSRTQYGEAELSFLEAIDTPALD
jgi:hypothetical protein